MQPLLGIEVKLVDDDSEVALGNQGKVPVRGSNVSIGYDDEPEATAAVFQADGWFPTGDIACVNGDGFLKVCDHKKELPIVNGFNVAPAEVEGMLGAWEKIGEAAVVGVPDAHFGEVCAAFVVPTNGVRLTAEDVMAFAEETMASYVAPGPVETLDAPLNATGKVDKDQLRERATR